MGIGKLVIIANPYAHRNRLWPLASQSLRKAAPGVLILEAEKLDDLRAVARRALEERPEVIAIAGGDGTVTHVLTALVAVTKELGIDLPALSLLGGGAYDSLAPLGGRGAAEDKLKRLSDQLRTGTPLVIAPRDALLVDGQCGFRVGVGLPVRFVEEIYATGKPGPLTGARMLVRAVASSLVRGSFAQKLYRPMETEVEVDGELWPPIPLFGVVCSSVAESGLGLRPFRRATEQPGFFQVLGLTAGPLAFSLELPRLLLGHEARRDRLIDAVAERVELSGQRGLPYFLDGELRKAGEKLVIGLGPRLHLVRA